MYLVCLLYHKLHQLILLTLTDKNMSCQSDEIFCPTKNIVQLRIFTKVSYTSGTKKITSQRKYFFCTNVAAEKNLVFRRL